MSRKKILIFIAFLMLITSNSLLLAQCKIAQLIQENKAKIPSPYKYDGFTYINFEFGQESKIQKKEFIAFKGQKYQLLFCTSGFEENVRIQIFDTKNNTLIAGTSVGDNVNNWTFAPSETGIFSIVYEIPPSYTKVAHEACIAMLIGFMEK